MLGFVSGVQEWVFLRVRTCAMVSLLLAAGTCAHLAVPSHVRSLTSHTVFPREVWIEDTICSCFWTAVVGDSELGFHTPIFFFFFFI